MTPFERHKAVLNGETPDKVDVVFAEGLRNGPQGGIVRRLSRRGMGRTHIVSPYKPMFFFDTMVNPYIPEISYSVKNYYENGLWISRHIFDTPVGSIFSDVGKNPNIDLSTGSVMTHFVKERKDWKPLNYLFNRMYESLRPNYDEILMDQEDLGQSGTTIGVVDKTPFQRLWIELLSLEETIYSIIDEVEELEEFIDIQMKFHRRAAEITAESPAQHIQLIDNITNIISPDYYRKYCMPVYKIYKEAIQGTDKLFCVHHDGLMAHLKDEIAEASFDAIDSFTIPPVGDVSITEAKDFWPDKQLFINLPPHIAFAEKEELCEVFSGILSEWGSKRLVIEHVEDMPEESLEKVLTAALDVYGY